MNTLIDQFLSAYQGRLKPSSLSDYRSILHHHLAFFPDLPAMSLGLEDYLSGLALTGKRKNNILCVARTFYGWAARRQIAPGPMLPIPRFPHRTVKTKPLSLEEARQVMSFTPQPYRDFYRLSILTGLRTGEALALQFQDFDLAHQVLRIRRAFSGGVISSTKTASSDRDIPLLRPVRELYEQRQRYNLKSSPWFFYSGKGGIFSLKKLREVWRVFLELFGIEPRRMYSTRHTFASLAIAAGEDALWVARVLGHSRPDQLFLRYASFMEGMKEDGKKFLGALSAQSFNLRLAK
jgi:integrase